MLVVAEADILPGFPAADTPDLAVWNICTFQHFYISQVLTIPTLSSLRVLGILRQPAELALGHVFEKRSLQRESLAAAVTAPWFGGVEVDRAETGVGAELLEGKLAIRNRTTMK